MKWIGFVAVAALVAASPSLATGDESAASKRSCSTINLGGPRIFTKHNMRCDKAKQKARRVYESGGSHQPQNFSCTSGSHFQDGAFCEHVSEDKYFGWHPADKRPQG